MQKLRLICKTESFQIWVIIIIWVIYYKLYSLYNTVEGQSTYIRGVSELQDFFVSLNGFTKSKRLKR